MSYQHGYTTTLRAAGITKVAYNNSYLKDFAAGVDPFGLYTNALGRDAEAARLSDEEHRIKRTLGTAGGFVGGAAILPSAISGLSGGLQGMSNARGGLGARLASGAAGAMDGAKKPFRAVIDGRRAIKGLSRVSEGGGEFTPQELKSLGFAVGNVPMGTVHRGTLQGVDAAKNFAKNITLGDIKDHVSSVALSSMFRRGGGTGGHNLLDTLKDKATQGAAKAALPQVQSGVNTALGQLAMGGSVGAFGAHAQYEAGRQAERDTSIGARLKKLVGREQ